MTKPDGNDLELLPDGASEGAGSHDIGGVQLVTVLRGFATARRADGAL
jgi:hypothetical protein